jgi:hypothetical protein
VGSIAHAADMLSAMMLDMCPLCLGVGLLVLVRYNEKMSPRDVMRVTHCAERFVECGSVEDFNELRRLQSGESS